MRKKQKFSEIKTVLKTAIFCDVTWYSLVDKYHYEICNLLEAAMSGNSKELPLNAA